MSTSTITHHAAPMAAAAGAVVAIALGGVAFVDRARLGAVRSYPPTRSRAWWRRPSTAGHYEYTASGGKLVGGP